MRVFLFPFLATHFSRANWWHVYMILSSIVDVRQLELPSSERCHWCGCTGSWSACTTWMDSGLIAVEAEKKSAIFAPVTFQAQTIQSLHFSYLSCICMRIFFFAISPMQNDIASFQKMAIFLGTYCVKFWAITHRQQCLFLAYSCIIVPSVML